MLLRMVKEKLQAQQDFQIDLVERHETFVLASTEFPITLKRIPN